MLAVISQIESGTPLCEMGSLIADLISIIRISRTVSIVVKVSENSVLESHIAGVGGARQNSKTPTGMIVLVFFRISGMAPKAEQNCRSQGKDSFFHHIIFKI